MSHQHPQTVEEDFDVIVVGGGHAGTEAAVAAARLGARVGLITSALGEHRPECRATRLSAELPRAPSFGKSTRLAGSWVAPPISRTVQFRMLNRGKGAAVWAPRAQCDRGIYRRAVRTLLEQHPSLRCIQGTVARLILDPRRRTVFTASRPLRVAALRASTVVITTGTFLRGRIHIGTRTRISGGRAGEASSIDLAEQLENAGLDGGAIQDRDATAYRRPIRRLSATGVVRTSELDQFDYSWSHFWSDSIPTQRQSPTPAVSDEKSLPIAIRNSSNARAG